MGRGQADRLFENDPAMDVALVATRLLVALLLAAVRIAVVARVVVSPRVANGIRNIIFFRAVQFIILRIDGAGWRRHGHHVSSDSGLRSRCTAGVLSNFSIRSASSNRSSTRKRRSGANFRLTRCATSPRRNFLLRASAASTTSVSLPPSGITYTVASFRSGDIRTS